MSQKSEKYARNLRKEMEDTKTRMTHTEEQVDRLAVAFDAVHSQTIADADRERLTARRQVRQAERKARTWKHIAYAALVAAIIVEIIAIWAVNREREVPPLVVTTEQQAVSMTADAPRIGAPTLAQLLDLEAVA